MTTLLLIRHGQTDWNAQGRWQGHLDIPLNDTGKNQATAVAKRLSGWPIQAIYSSDLRRAAMTASTIATALNLEPQFDPIWRERNVGAFEGLTGFEAREKYPDAWDQRKNHLLSPPNGEDNPALRLRAVRAYEQTLAKHRGEMVVIVSHGGALANVIAHVLEIPPDRNGRFRLSGNTGLSIIEYSEDRGAQLVLLNDIAHLQKTPIYLRELEQ